MRCCLGHRTPGVRLENTNELIHLRAFKYLHVKKKYPTYFNVWVSYFVWNLKGTFEIPQKISYRYIEKYNFYATKSFCLESLQRKRRQKRK